MSDPTAQNTPSPRKIFVCKVMQADGRLNQALAEVPIRWIGGSPEVLPSLVGFVVGPHIERSDSVAKKVAHSGCSLSKRFRRTGTMRNQFRRKTFNFNPLLPIQQHFFPLSMSAHFFLLKSLKCPAIMGNGACVDLSTGQAQL